MKKLKNKRFGICIAVAFLVLAVLIPAMAASAASDNGIPGYDSSTGKITRTLIFDASDFDGLSFESVSRTIDYSDGFSETDYIEIKIPDSYYIDENNERYVWSDGTNVYFAGDTVKVYKESNLLQLTANPDIKKAYVFCDDITTCTYELEYEFDISENNTITFTLPAIESDVEYRWYFIDRFYEPGEEVTVQLDESLSDGFYINFDGLCYELYFLARETLNK